MAKSKAPRSFLEQLANSEDPAPKDFDPENDVEKHGVGTDSESEEDDAGQVEAREHYLDVGESKLRKPTGIDLGPQYSGASVSRGVLEEKEDIEDDPFAARSRSRESDEMVDEIGGAFDSAENGSDMDEASQPSKGLKELEISSRSTGQGRSMALDAEKSHGKDESLEQQVEDMSDVSSQDQEDNSSKNDTESDTSSPPSLQNHRTALRKMMAQEQKTVAASLSAAAKADIAKGRAIQQQRRTFDNLLNTRIKLQKALIATNSLAAVPSQNSTIEDHTLTIRAAEKAAVSLWNSLNSLRAALGPRENAKKHSIEATVSSPSSTIWTETVALDAAVLPHHRTTLTKWSQRTNPATILRPQNRFSQAPTQQSLTSVLDSQLTGESMERAVKRTRTARSCAPIQAASRIVSEDEQIFDDADFYTLLLRELVERRMADSQSTSVAPNHSVQNNVATLLPSRAELKVKKSVDTKASKGRKMRYTVHEKLQNFMAAEDRGSWGERQRSELFGSLLGNMVRMEEGAVGEEDGEEYDEEAEGGLKLFGR